MAVELSSNALLSSVHCLFGIGKWRETYWAHWSRLILLTKLETRKTTSLLSGENLDLLEVSGKLDESVIQIDSWALESSQTR